MEKNFKLFVSRIFVLLIVILGIWFVIAAALPPTAVHFENNVTTVYDEGNFSLNWTAGSANSTSYNIFSWVNISGVSNLFSGAVNNSVRGFSFNNWTEGNYTFHVSATDGTGFGANSSNVSIYVDRTAPVISLPSYTNATSKKNTEQLTLNISVIDASSGTTGSLCLVDINGTNESVAVSSGWCNSTAFNLTGSSDGNQTIKVYVNDTVNILGLNNSFVVGVDTTGPTASPSCSPTTIQAGDSFPCTCSGSDATTGVSTSTGSSTSGSITSTSQTGVFTYTCSVTDNAGNTASATATYAITQTPGNPVIPPTTPASRVYSFTKITPGAAVIMKDFNDSIILFIF